MKIIDTTGRTIADGHRTSRVVMRIGVRNLDGTHMEPGEQYDIPDYFAIELVNTGRAVAVTPTEPGVIEHADPSPEQRDPQPKRRR